MYKRVLSYSLKCWKNTESKNAMVANTNVFIKMCVCVCVAVKHQDLLKNNKLKDYQVA